METEDFSPAVVVAVALRDNFVFVAGRLACRGANRLAKICLKAVK